MRTRGFTILEVILAVGLLVLLTGGMYAFLWNLLARRETVALEAARDQAVGTLFERLEADLAGAIAGDGKHAGLVGRPNGITIHCRGVAMPLRARDCDAAMGDMQGTQLAFDAGVLRGRRWAGEGEPSGEFEEVSGDVQRVRFRYSDGRQWRSSFDSAAAGTLPVAVEVAVWFGTPETDQTPEQGVGDAASPPEREPGDRPRGTEPSAEPTARPKTPTREPDRRRLIIVPDGPVAAWKGGTR